MKFRDAVQEIKERLNIVDVIGEYVSLKRSGSNYIGLCPFHNEDTPSFVVSDAKQIYRCFGQCNKGGNIYTFLQEYLHISFREAVIMLSKKAGIDIDDDNSFNEQYKINEEKKKRLYDLYRDVANAYYKTLFSDIGKPGLDYFKNRILSKETIKKFGLGYAPNSFGYMYNLMKDKGYDDNLLFESKLFRLYNDKPCDTFYNRVMFPLVDINKHVVGFQSRTLDPKPKERKYVNSEDTLIFHKKSFLYAMNYAFFSKEDFLILCEGNMDAITIHQSGFDNAVATMGTAFNENQMNLIKRKTKKVYLCQDTDEAGINAVISSDRILKNAGIETYVLDFKPSKDVDEFINTYGVQEFEKRLSSPIPTILYYVSTLKSKYNLSNPYEQEKYFDDIIREVAKINNSFVRDNYIKKIAIQENLDAGVLKSLLNNYFKGNKVKIYNEKSINKIDSTNNKTEYSKIDSNFIYLIFLVPDCKEQIKNCVDANELFNETYKYLYKLYLEGKSISDIYNFLDEKTEEEKYAINSIIDSNSDIENDRNKIIESLNQIIRQIKIRHLNNSSKNNLDLVFENNIKIKEINNKKFVV
ncbi:MAG: DNA primase [Lachnospiraceae bacterium]|nr:DNA primase [Lachnospiraceae bacterium]